MNSFLFRKKDRYLAAFLLALGLSFLFFLPFLIYDKGYFIYCGDFNAQQIPFYINAHDSILSGDIGWNWYTDLGANFLGSYSFYLAGSPFFALTLLFPSQAVPYLMAPLLMLKFAFASLFAYCYLRRHVRNPDFALLGALLYAFSGFSLYNIFFNHFHEAIVFFPLLLLGLDLLMEEDRKGVFACFVFVNCFVNYFFFVGEVVFLIMYFVLRMLEGKWKLTGKRFTCLALESLIGVGLSCVLLLPSVLATLGNSRVESLVEGWNALLYDNNQVTANVIKSMFFPPDQPSMLIYTPEAYGRWSSVASWLPLFGMTGVISWLACKKKTWLKRIIILCIAMSLIPLLNSMFTAFNSSYYARWFYMMTLMFALATAKAWEDPEVDWAVGIRWSAFITDALTLAIGLTPNGKDEDGHRLLGVFSREYGEYSARFWLYCAIALLALVLVIRLYRKQKQHPEKFARSALCTFLVFTLIFTVYYLAIGKIGGSYNSRTYYVPVALHGADQVDLPEGENYRIDTPESGIQNLGMHWKQKNIHAFQSMVPKSVFDFYHSLGITRDVASRAEIERYALRALTSVRFSFCEKQEDTDYLLRTGYSYYGNQNGYTVLENQNYIPMGFTYQEYISRSDYEKLDTAHREFVMLAALVVEDEDVPAAAQYLAPFSTTREDYMMYSKFSSLCQERSASVCDHFTVTRQGFTAEYTSDQPRMVFFSVPYDDGWSVTVNGEPQDPYQTNVGFMSVLCEAGHNEIVFTYHTPGLLAGVAVSAGSLLALLLYLLFWYIWEKRHAPSAAS